MLNRSLTGLIFSLVFVSSQTLAQNEFSLGTLQPGQLLLNLSATEQVEVDQDTLNANVEFTVQGRDQTALQDEVNTAMSKALELLRAQDAVEYTTTQYQVYIFEPGRPARSDIDNPAWRAQQGVALTSKDSAALLDLVGQLQANGLVVTSLYYSLSTERYEEVADGLMAAALGKLQNRADQAAQGLGKSSAELVEVSLDGSPNFAFRDRQVMYSMAANAEMAPPSAEPGQTQVSLTVSARAVLSP